MKKILVGILFYAGCLFAADNIEGIGAGAAIVISSSMRQDIMSDNEKVQACKNEIRAVVEKQNIRPFLDNYEQSMDIAVSRCLKDLK